MDAQRREDAHAILDALLNIICEIEERRTAIERITPGDRDAVTTAEIILQKREVLREEIEGDLAECLAGGEDYDPLYYGAGNKKKAVMPPEEPEKPLDVNEEAKPEEPEKPLDFKTWWKYRHVL